MQAPIRILPALALLAAASAPAHAQLFPFQNNDPDLVRCESVDNREVTCQVPIGRVATFAQQHSQSACTAGTSYNIYRDRIVVSRGCRASFRLGDVSVLGDATLRSEVRTALATELARKIRIDNNFGSTPSITIDSERERPQANGQVGYDGIARVTRSDSLWRTVEFTSLYDLSRRAIVALDYRTPTTDVTPGTQETGQRRTLLRTRVDTAIESRLYEEYRNNRSNPRFELLTDSARVVSSNETAYSGTGRIMVDGANWRPITFEATYDWRTETFRNLTYRLATDGAPGTGGSTMDASVEAAIERALVDEVRRQKGGGDVQVVVNRRHVVRRDGGSVSYTGKFGYSWNDGEWLTRGYEAQLNPAASAQGQQVRSVRVWRLGGL